MEYFYACIGSNDKRQIAKSHMGDTSFFIICKVEKNRITFTDERINAYKDLEHSKGDKKDKILSVVKDCQVLVSSKNSPNFKKISKNSKFQPVIVEADYIDDVANKLQQNFNEIAELLKKRNEGEISQDIPIF